MIVLIFEIIRSDIVLFNFCGLRILMFVLFDVIDEADDWLLLFSLLA